MADIANIFHWPLSEIGLLPLDELLQWRNRAVERDNQRLRFMAQAMGNKMK